MTPFQATMVEEITEGIAITKHGIVRMRFLTKEKTSHRVVETVIQDQASIKITISNKAIVTHLATTIPSTPIIRTPTDETILAIAMTIPAIATSSQSLRQTDPAKIRAVSDTINEGTELALKLA